jgi:Na+-driven multidrug efflux pump
MTFLSVAVPSILQQSFISIGNLVIQGEVNIYGSGVMSGYGTAVKLNNVVITSLTAVGNGVSNYTAQNVGAGKLLRVKKGFLSSLIISYSIVLIISLIYLIFTNLLLSFFINNKESIDNPKEKIDEAYMVARSFIYIVAPFYIVIATKLASDGVLRGSRMMKQFMCATLIDLLLRVLLSFMFNSLLGANGIWWSWPIGWIVSGIISISFFIYRYKNAKDVDSGIEQIEE